MPYIKRSERASYQGVLSELASLIPAERERNDREVALNTDLLSRAAGERNPNQPGSPLLKQIDNEVFPVGIDSDPISGADLARSAVGGRDGPNVFPRCVVERVPVG